MNIVEDFENFHRNNPHVYEVLVRLTRQWVSRFGREHTGIARIYEAARWEIAMSTDDPTFKINNNYKAFYARLIMRREKDLDGLFKLRKSAADTWESAA